MPIRINACAKCGRWIGFGEMGYFKLNEVTDKFDLECEQCYGMEVQGQENEEKVGR